MTEEATNAAVPGAPGAEAAAEVRARLLGDGLSARDVSMQFAGVPVLRNVSVTFKPGEVHSLMGENGAGKSTLVKILAGTYTATSGEFILGGNPISLGAPRAALAHGIYLVPQEPSLSPYLSVAENLFLGSLLARGTVIKIVDWRRMRRESTDVLRAVGLDVDPDAAASTLTIAQQQLLECARALVQHADVIFFDEPTSPLTATEVERLFRVINNLRDMGCAIGFISHRTNEVLELSDHITVLRDGRVVDSVMRSEAQEQRLIVAMLGHSLEVSDRAGASAGSGEPILSVLGLRNDGWFNDISFDVRPGEVVGLAGLVGSGRTEIAETIMGLRRANGGQAMFMGKDIIGRKPADILGLGLTYLPEDRARHGIFIDMSVEHNLTASTFDRLRNALGLLNQPLERKLAKQMATQVHLRGSWLQNPIQSLSGGNQQRSLFGKLLLSEPKAAIFDEPTRGVDAGAKDDIHQIIRSLAADGLAVLVISSELEEIVQVCDRVLVVYEGQIVSELVGDEISREAIGLHIVGSQVGNV